jgi:hypothetical protein
MVLVLIMELLVVLFFILIVFLVFPVFGNEVFDFVQVALVLRFAIKLEFYFIVFVIGVQNVHHDVELFCFVNDFEQNAKGNPNGLCDLCAFGGSHKTDF